MQGLTVAEPKFPGDDGTADPAVRAALAAYAAGQGSEHAALTALARSRLLVPVVAVLGEADENGSEKSTEMALPTLVGQDGPRARVRRPRESFPAAAGHHRLVDDTGATLALTG